MPGEFLHPETVLKQLGVRKGMKVADFGCGAGYFAMLFGKIVGEEGKVAAVDVMEEALQSVRSKMQIEKIGNVNAIRGNLEVMGGSKLDNESQDLVFLANVLFQSNKKLEILKEASRVAKIGGVVVLINWKPNVPLGPSADLKFSPETAKELAEKAGLKLEKEFSAGNYHYGLIFKK